VPTQVTQIEKDGSTTADFDPAQVPFEDQETIIRDGLNDRGWNVTFLQSDKQTRRRLFKMSKGPASLEVITYIFSNLSWSSGGRSHDEKRIQLSRPFDEHADDFQLAKDGSPRCALMGIYRRNGLTLFCAWDPSAYLNHSNPSSCYVRADAMASAARSGFGQSLDAKKRLVCCFTPDLLPYYIENMAFLHDHIVSSNELLPVDGEEFEEASDQIDVEINPIKEGELPRNRIYYGAPGTGKSHNLNSEVERYFPDEYLYERTTFFPDYTSGVFMGAYRPAPIYRESEGVFYEADQTSSAPKLEPLIDYRFVPGPFLRLLIKALKNPEHNFCLVIEEINRANASAVFADAFQMLDRDNTGSGKYKVTLPAEAQQYLAYHGYAGSVGLPSNMYIWATMNSADQGVFSLDSAFKRRWAMEYVGLDEGELVVKDWELKLSFLPEPMKWNTFRKAVNSHLAKQGVAEDRLLGPFFITEEDLGKPKAFEDKIIQYLRDDVMRTAPGKLFVGESLSFGALVAAYRKGENIFVKEIEFSGG
jgi:AAA domain (dynein-related subfamily)